LIKKAQTPIESAPKRSSSAIHLDTVQYTEEGKKIKPETIRPSRTKRLPPPITIRKSVPYFTIIASAVNLILYALMTNNYISLSLFLSLYVGLNIIFRENRNENKVEEKSNEGIECYSWCDDNPISSSPFYMYRRMVWVIVLNGGFEPPAQNPLFGPSGNTLISTLIFLYIKHSLSFIHINKYTEKLSFCYNSTQDALSHFTE
jgi:hypothetical protein